MCAREIWHSNQNTKMPDPCQPPPPRGHRIHQTQYNTIGHGGFYVECIWGWNRIGYLTVIFRGIKILNKNILYTYTNYTYYIQSVQDTIMYRMYIVWEEGRMLYCGWELVLYTGVVSAPHPQGVKNGFWHFGILAFWLGCQIMRE